MQLTARSKLPHPSGRHCRRWLCPGALSTPDRNRPYDVRGLGACEGGALPQFRAAYRPCPFCRSSHQASTRRYRANSPSPPPNWHGAVRSPSYGRNITVAPSRQLANALIALVRFGRGVLRRFLDRDGGACRHREDINFLMAAQNTPSSCLSLPSAARRMIAALMPRQRATSTKSSARPLSSIQAMASRGSISFARWTRSS